MFQDRNVLVKLLKNRKCRSVLDMPIKLYKCDLSTKSPMGRNTFYPLVKDV